MGASRNAPDVEAPVLGALTTFLEHHTDCSAWCVAYSGGLDSTVLLHAMTRLRDRLGYSLRALHVHHGLQPQADAWARHCQQQASAWQVPIEIRSVQVEPDDKGIEAAARRARYTALAALMHAHERLLTAHHKDDQAETLLLNLMRGAGVQGLAGMAQTGCLKTGETPLWIGRPLLSVTRAQLQTYAEHHGLRSCEDPSNENPAFSRNWVRHHLLPEMKAFQPAVVTKLAETAQAMGEAALLLDELADELLADMTVGNDLSVEALRTLPSHRRRLVLRRWFALKQVYLGRKHLMALETLLHAASDRQPRVHIGAAHAARWQGRLIYPLKVVPDWHPLPWAERKRLAWFRFEGEAPASAQLMPFSQTGLTLKPFKKVFQHAGIPPWDRARWPVLMLKEQAVAIIGVEKLTLDAPEVSVAFIAELGAIG